MLYESILFRHKYRVASARLQSHDYTAPGWYFITICTDKRVPWFGNIHRGIMCVNNTGSIIAHEWQRTQFIRSNVQLDAWIIMPDHFHGIIRIIDNDTVETPRRGVSTNMRRLNDSWRPNSIGTIVNQFKSKCTKRIRKHHPNFKWQSRYYDRIIRSQRELDNVRKYIIENPMRWKP